VKQSTALIVMTIKWKKRKGLQPQVLLHKIESGKTLHSPGDLPLGLGGARVSFSGREYHDSFAALLSMIDLPQNLSHLDLDVILSDAVSKVASESTLTDEKVMDKINELASMLLRRREKEWKIVTSISISKKLPFKRLTIESARISLFEGEYPAKYASRLDVIKEPLMSEHDNYSKVIISIKAKSARGAANKAFRVIDLARAIISLIVNPEMEFFGNQLQPINKVRLGEVHTLHEKTGVEHEGEFWFEPNFVLAHTYIAVNHDTFKRNFRWYMNRLETCNYSRDLKCALLQYVRALDERDHNTAFISLWGALEQITTLPNERAKHESVVNRCAFIFKESEYHKQVLEHLREARNQSIHSGEQSDKAKTHCYQLQFYFRELIKFYLTGAAEFSDLSEAFQLLDLPPIASDLFKIQKSVNQALRFRGISDLDSE
jgi:hypothetical protein